MPDEVVKGTLAVSAKKAIRLKFKSKKGKDVEIAAQPDQLSAELSELSKGDVTKLDGQTVEFELGGPNKAVRIRAEGKPWTSAHSQAPREHRDGGRRVRQETGGQLRPDRERQQTRPVKGEFHNPYNFIPTPRRDKLPKELKDDRPCGHHSYDHDCFSGWIDVEMQTVTPLLIPDAMNATGVENVDAGHKSFPVRVGLDGKPYVPPTSMKGMLRSAYEAVTNSRLAVFAGHDAPVAYRMPARDGLKLVPAVVEKGQIKLLAGTAQPQSKGRAPLYAAWLQKYDRQKRNWNGLDQHRNKVWAYVTLWQHRNFQFWNVVELRPDGPTAPTDGPTDSRRPGRNSRPANPSNGQWVHGYVCVTGKNIDRKHDERVFFTTDKNPPQAIVTDKLRLKWEHLIANYQDIHEEERRKGQKGPPALKYSKWSRQVVGDKSERKLSEGTLCYADVSFHQGKLTVSELYPVNISRKLFDMSPRKLLHESLRPAPSLNKLSPADRVFGWVSQEDGRGAYRGNLRIGSIVCETDDAIEEFGEPGVPLTILGAAKPQQARFYVAGSEDGVAQASGSSLEDAGYQDGKALRGIKVFPHHHGPPDEDQATYWDNPLEDRTQRPNNGWSQEYRRPTPAEGSDAQLRDDQNRSMQGWVRPGVTFSCRIHVTNLSRFELGALLWLLSLNEEEENKRPRFHRLGGGKPLGFGSVRLAVKGLDIRDGVVWMEYYKSLIDKPCSKGAQIMLAGETTTVSQPKSQVIKDYKHIIKEAYKCEKFDQVSFIAAFVRAAEGFEDKKPMHYPRVRHSNGTTAPDPAGENFQWFGQNERNSRVVLKDLASDQGLPYYGRR